MSEEELEQILIKNRAMRKSEKARISALGTDLDSTHNTTTLTSSIEGNCFAAAIVEAYMSHSGYTCFITNTDEDIYLIHKPSRKSVRVDGGMVETTRCSRPRYSLVSLKEEEDAATIEYSRGQERFKKKFRIKGETSKVTRHCFKEE